MNSATSPEIVSLSPSQSDNQSGRAPYRNSTSGPTSIASPALRPEESIESRPSQRYWPSDGAISLHGTLAWTMLKQPAQSSAAEAFWGVSSIAHPRCVGNRDV